MRWEGIHLFSRLWAQFCVVCLTVRGFIISFSNCWNLPLQAYSTVGTPDYIAPEVLLKKGYGLECDW